MASAFRILVIEDDEVIRDTVSEYLRMAGYTVDAAPNGANAIEKLAASPLLPSLILLDLNMPVMSGKAFLQKLRERSQSCARIPVLLMSALPGECVAGVAGVLPKPFRLKSMLEQVQAFLGPG